MNVNANEYKGLPIYEAVEELELRKARLDECLRIAVEHLYQISDLCPEARGLVSKCMREIGEVTL